MALVGDRETSEAMRDLKALERCAKGVRGRTEAREC